MAQEPSPSVENAAPAPIAQGSALAQQPADHDEHGAANLLLTGALFRALFAP